MKYRVFIDTNIYDRFNYNFHNPQFEMLKKYARSSNLVIVINSIVKGEVEDHIIENMSQAVATLNKAVKSKYFKAVSQLEPFDEILKEQNTNIWVSECLKGFDSFLNDCCVECISLKEVDAETVISNYFQKLLPFESKKPYEFKDEISLQSILTDIKLFIKGQVCFGDNQYCVISADNGFREALNDRLSEDEKQFVCIFDSLDALLDKIAVSRVSSYLTAYFLSEHGRYQTEETILQAIQNCNIDIETENSVFIIEQDIIHIDVGEYTPYILEVSEENNEYDLATVAFNVRCYIEVCYSYIDSDNSLYDKEEREYLWLSTLLRNEHFFVDIDLTAIFDISNCRVPEEWTDSTLSEEAEFDKCEAEFLDYLDIPSCITLPIENLIK